MTKTNKGRVFVKRWGVSEVADGVVNFYANPRALAVDGLAQMRYRTFLLVFGIPLAEKVVYELHGKATVKQLRVTSEKKSS